MGSRYWYPSRALKIRIDTVVPSQVHSRDAFHW